MDEDYIPGEKRNQPGAGIIIGAVIGVIVWCIIIGIALVS